MGRGPGAVVGIDADLRVVCIDDEIVVIDKPAGMPSVPARTPHDPPSVVDRLVAVLGPVEAVHRLDRDTSGLLVLARSASARATLGRAFETRSVAKRYLAVIAGTLPGERGTVHLPLGPDALAPPRQRVDPILGRRAESRWLQVATVDPGGGRRTLVALEPVTGRSHQLRAHLAWLGTPIVGDRLYGGPGTDALALHAARIEFPHPGDGRAMTLVSEPPAVHPWTLFGAGEITQAWRTVGSSADDPTCDQ